jgi:hypothetical protein
MVGGAPALRQHAGTDDTTDDPARQIDRDPLGSNQVLVAAADWEAVMTDSVYRGSRGIAEIIERMTPLVEWTKQNKPGQMCMILQRRDYDLIARWPKAAHVNGITVMQNGELWWRGLELVYDQGLSRYAKLKAPEQLDVEKS